MKFECTTKDVNKVQACKAEWSVYVSKKEITVDWHRTPYHPEGSGTSLTRITETDTGI